MSLRRDVTELFTEIHVDGELNGDEAFDTSHLDYGKALSLPDPLGIVERLTHGNVKDPLRHKILELLDKVRS